MTACDFFLYYRCEVFEFIKYRGINKPYNGESIGGLAMDEMTLIVDF